MSSVQTTEFVRKTFRVNAVQVTAENMSDVAKWCGGEIRHTKPRPEENVPSAPYIKVKVFKPMTERQTRGYVGDWILESGESFKVYPDKSFKHNFDLPPKEEKVGSNGAHLSDEDVAHSL